MKQIDRITDRATCTEAYHQVMAAVEAFQRVSVNSPRVLQEVVAHIYGRFDSCAYHVYSAGNTRIIKKKVDDLTIASSDLFFQWSSLELLVKSKGLTVGAANEVIMKLRPAYDSINKWLNSCIKQLDEID